MFLSKDKILFIDKFILLLYFKISLSSSSINDNIII